MNALVFRYNHDTESTQGLFIVDGKFFSFTLEDQRQTKAKVPGETRIPAGIYELGIQKAETPLTKKYRDQFSWFEHHIQILKVPNFSNVYIHVGNDPKDTEGCVLLGDIAYNDPSDFKGYQVESVQAYERFYKLVYPQLKKAKKGDEPHTIAVKDMWDI